MNEDPMRNVLYLVGNSNWRLRIAGVARNRSGIAPESDEAAGSNPDSGDDVAIARDSGDLFVSAWVFFTA
jgi:hypothetical protein